jgi:hypothetical protein
MKKTTRKLVLRAETIRELSALALTHVIGGQETDAAADYPYSRPKQCDAAAAYPYSRERQCDAAGA